MTPTVPSKPALDIHEVDESGEVIVHDPKSGQMVVLNVVGAATLELIDGNRDVASIVAELAKVFDDVAREDIERDVHAFLSDLAERGLIELTKSP